MLDDRLIGTCFTLTTVPTGMITLYGIHYHYRVLDHSQPGAVVCIVAADALGLKVQAPKAPLQY
ncbi:hypothetical protein ACFQ5J_00200 [Lacticaseibacillus baoqingensis]|uniref:Uncharacterized protein n=1 Tax=Lacticaseibacillus baoqingensis TaxID=2486013 RepID=A0ABW4E5A9_9LACO|nr:hypothetical protein [Lacticaseibacillus baoqingensis]